MVGTAKKTRKTGGSYCENQRQELRNYWKMDMDRLVKLVAETTGAEAANYQRQVNDIRKNYKGWLDKFFRYCKQVYSNPGCKGTLFEAGEKMPDGLTAKSLFRDDKVTENGLKEERRDIFGKKMNVLKDGFYEKLPKDVVASLKDAGAISGCFMIGNSKREERAIKRRKTRRRRPS